MIATQKSSAPRPAFWLPLENGDRLTRPEFERRYERMPRLKKAELIEGVVYMTSAVRFDHAYAHGRVLGWIAVYFAATPGVHFADNATVRIDGENDAQPDILLCVAHGGRSRLSADNYVEGVPELIVEIAGSSAAYDLHDKLRVYRRNGVPEYLIWQMHEQQFDWLIWQDGEYAALPPDADGIIRSRAFPGLWLDVESLLAGNLAHVLEVVQQGVQTAEHAAFVRSLSPDAPPVSS